MSGFIAVARLDEDLPEDGQKLVRVAGKSILLVRCDGQVFAVENRCTHDNEQLVGGLVRKCSIVCPYHGARFRLSDGRPYGPPAFEPLQTFAVRLDGGEILISTDDQN